MRTDEKKMLLLIVGNTAATLIAIVALILALISISDIESSRINGRRQSCRLIRAGLQEAASPDRIAAVNGFITHHALSDCNTYAQGPR